MIIVRAEMWPQGNQSNSYEIFTATVNNNGGAGKSEHYAFLASVLSRPDHNYGTPGFSADIEVPNYNAVGGFIPLFMSVLAATQYPNGEDSEGLVLPPSRPIRYVKVQTQDEFGQLLKGR